MESQEKDFGDDSGERGRPDNENGGGRDKLITIYVNTAATKVPHEKIAFEELVKIAFGPGADPSAGYRVTYERGNGESKDLPEKGKVMVHEGMIFNVSPTGLS